MVGGSGGGGWEEVSLQGFPFFTCSYQHPRSVAMVMSGWHEVEKEAGWTSPAVVCFPPMLRFHAGNI